jgi:hypothetical protein
MRRLGLVYDVNDAIPEPAKAAWESGPDSDELEPAAGGHRQSQDVPVPRPSRHVEPAMSA